MLFPKKVELNLNKTWTRTVEPDPESIVATEFFLLDNDFDEKAAPEAWKLLKSWRRKLKMGKWKLPEELA